MSDALNDLMKLKYPDKEWKTFTHMRLYLIT